jgi:hypothetical protein
MGSEQLDDSIGCTTLRMYFTRQTFVQGHLFKVAVEPHITVSASCTRWIEIEPSPTADATRFTLPERMSPTA